MRISDGSSDVCSSDLDPGLLAHDAEDAVRVGDEAGALIGLRDEIGELRGQEILADGKAGLIIVGDDRRQREQVVDARVGDPHGPQHAPDVGDGIALRIAGVGADAVQELINGGAIQEQLRSEEHTSELQSLMRISYAVFCLKKKNTPHVYYTKLYKST